MQYYEDVDQLGAINKAIAELEATARKLKARIQSRGVGVQFGERFMADVTEYDRTQLNPKLVRELVDADVVSACTEIKHITSVTVKEARINGNP